MLKKLELLLIGSSCLLLIPTHWKPTWFLPFVYVRIPRNRSQDKDSRSRYNSRFKVQGDPRRNWKGKVEVRHKGKKPNKDAISGNVPWSVLWCVRASEFAPTPSTEAGLSFFHSCICQSLAKGMATSGTLAHCMWGESGTSSPSERLHRGSQVLEVRIKGTWNPEERCMEIGKGLWGHLGEAPALSVMPPFSDCWRALAWPN